MKQISNQDLEKLSHHKQIIFACFCAEQVLDLIEARNKQICKEAIETTYSFLEGKASKEKCRAAASAVFNTYAFAHLNTYVDNNAIAAIYVTANAAAEITITNAAHKYIIKAIAGTPNGKQIIEAQWAFYDQLLNGDKYFEEIVLKS